MTHSSPPLLFISIALPILYGITFTNPKSDDDVEIIYEKSLIGTVAEARLPQKYATGLSDPYAQFENVSPTLLKKIQKLFQADFDLFGYSPLNAIEKSLLPEFSNEQIPEKLGRKKRIQKILVEEWAMPKASLMRMKISHNILNTKV